MAVSTAAIVADADLFRRAYPGWPHAAPRTTTPATQGGTMFDRLDGIVAGDMIDVPFWPRRVTVTGIWRSGGGVLSRVAWSAPEGDGVTSLPTRALVRLVRPFLASESRPAYQAPPSPVWDAAEAMTEMQVRGGIHPDRWA